MLVLWFLIDVHWWSHALVDDDGRLVVLARGWDIDRVRLGGSVVLLGRRCGSLVGLLGWVLGLVGGSGFVLRLLSLWWTGIENY